MDDRPLKLVKTCDHLRHKLMYTDERQTVTGYLDNQSDTRVFWCTQTMDPLGPDRKLASPEKCGADRKCYCEPTHPQPNVSPAGANGAKS